MPKAAPSDFIDSIPMDIIGLDGASVPSLLTQLSMLDTTRPASGLNFSSARQIDAAASVRVANTDPRQQAFHDVLL